MHIEQLLRWSNITDAEHSITSGSNEQEDLAGISDISFGDCDLADHIWYI